MKYAKKLTSTISAAILSLATVAPAAQAGDKAVFGGKGQTEALAASEMQETQGEVGFMAAATGVLVFAAGAQLGYTIGSDLAE